MLCSRQQNIKISYSGVRKSFQRSPICGIQALQPSGGPRQAPKSAAMTPTARLASSKLKVIDLVASCVEINSDVARFEEIAGRSAMVAFSIALFVELLLPQSGLFGAWGSKSYSLYLCAALTLIGGAAGLAAMSKRKVGTRLREAVLTSLTALSRSASSITNKNVDSAVDYVFEQVLGSSFYDFELLDSQDFDDFV